MEPISLGLAALAGGAVVAFLNHPRKESIPSYDGWAGVVYIPEVGTSRIGFAEILSQELAKRKLDVGQRVRQDILASLLLNGDSAWSSDICPVMLHLVVVGEITYREVTRTFNKGPQTFDEYTLTVRFYGPSGSFLGGTSVPEIDYGAGKEEVVRAMLKKVMVEIDSRFFTAIRDAVMRL
jgi:hypothetical protein